MSEPAAVTAPAVSGVRAFVLDGFDDARIDGAHWDDVLRRGDTAVVYLTRNWQRAWWDALGPGRLLLVAGEREGRIVAIAPLYAEAGVLFFVGTGNADYMDFIGAIDIPEVLDAMLDAAARATPDFCGLRLYAVPEASGTARRLQDAATRLGWSCFGQHRAATPRIDLLRGRARALLAANGPKVSKRDRYFSRQGTLELREFTRADEIRPRLGTLFDQHTARWEAAGVRSPFFDAGQRRFLDAAVARSDAGSEPRLTWLEWNGRPIACEFAWIYRGVYYAVASSFAPDLASRSPGQVLQRRIVLSALESGLSAYDFGNGDYPYKLLYATDIAHVETWSLHPASTTASSPATAC